MAGDHFRRCAIFGQHPICFNWGFDEEDDGCRKMKLELLQQIMVLRRYGVTQFFVACDFGVGLYAAEQINILRETDPDMMLFCVTPYEEQATKWAPYLRERYFKMLAKCSHMECVDLHARSFAQLSAYKRIIDQADVLLTVFDVETHHDGRNENKAFFYAIGEQKAVINLDPYTLKTQVFNSKCMEQ